MLGHPSPPNSNKIYVGALKWDTIDFVSQWATKRQYNLLKFEVHKNSVFTLSWIRGVRGHSPIFKQKHSILGQDFDFAYKELTLEYLISVGSWINVGM